MRQDVDYRVWQYMMSAQPTRVMNPPDATITPAVQASFSTYIYSDADID
jgi:hypothetical protein